MSPPCLTVSVTVTLGAKQPALVAQRVPPEKDVTVKLGATSSIRLRVTNARRRPARDSAATTALRRMEEEEDGSSEERGGLLAPRAPPFWARWARDGMFDTIVPLVCLAILSVAVLLYNTFFREWEACDPDKPLAKRERQRSLRRDVAHLEIACSDLQCVPIVSCARLLLLQCQQATGLPPGHARRPPNIIA